MKPFDQRVAALLQLSMSRAEKAKALAELIRAERNYHWVGIYDVSATHISGWGGRVRQHTRGSDLPGAITRPIARPCTIDVESDRVNAFGAEDETFLQECTTLLRPLWQQAGSCHDGKD